MFLLARENSLVCFTEHLYSGFLEINIYLSLVDIRKCVFELRGGSLAIDLSLVQQPV